MCICKGCKHEYDDYSCSDKACEARREELKAIRAIRESNLHTNEHESPAEYSKRLHSL